MNTSGWLLSASLCAAAFLPAIGARTEAARRRLLLAGAASALVVGTLAVRSANQPGEGFFPSEAGWAFLLVGVPLGAGTAAAGLVLVLTRSTRLPDMPRAALAVLAFVGVPGALWWRFLG